MALEQSVVDILPAATIGQFEATGINTKTARLLGKSATLSYYATSKGNDKICVIAVTPNGTGNMMACTLVKGFEEYGLRVSSGDLSEGGWLVAPNTTQIAQERDTENRWEQAANNFLTR